MSELPQLQADGEAVDPQAAVADDNEMQDWPTVIRLQEANSDVAAEPQAAEPEVVADNIEPTSVLARRRHRLQVGQLDEWRRQMQQYGLGTFFASQSQYESANKIRRAERGTNSARLQNCTLKRDLAFKLYQLYGRTE